MLRSGVVTLLRRKVVSLHRQGWSIYSGIRWSISPVFAFKVLLFILLTLIPSASFYAKTIHKISIKMNIFEFYKNDFSTFIFLIILGLIIASLAILFWNQYDITKKREKLSNIQLKSIEKALLDHALRIQLYKEIIYRITTDQLENLKFNEFLTSITHDEKKYLGFTESEINSANKFKLPNLSNPAYRSNSDI